MIANSVGYILQVYNHNTLQPVHRTNYIKLKTVLRVKVKAYVDQILHTKKNSLSNAYIF